jgi:protein-L-isoaspartate(D-aspartate) O-methyltransferase
MTEHNFDHMRRGMVASQLRTTGVNDPRVLAAMGAVPRELFVPKAMIPVAYADAQVPLGGGRDLNSPMALGKLLTEAHPQEGDRALVIGAATGYAAAVLAQLVGFVVAVEADGTLLSAAREALAGSGVVLVESPLAEGYAEGAPYDLILIDGAVEQVPEALVDQLADRGRLATGLLENGVSRLALGRKSGGAFGLLPFADVAATILPGFERPRVFSF